MQCVVLSAALALCHRGPGLPPQEEALAEYFGFQGLEIVRIDEAAGPLCVGDVDGDGLLDLVVANNHASRIEVHRQKRGASPDDVIEAVRRPNELPEHWRFHREPIAVAHRVGALVSHDFDGDGLLDLIYGGAPPELVFLRQARRGEFEVSRRHHVRDLMTTRNGLAVAQVVGDPRPELLAIVRGEIHVFALEGDALGRPVRLSAGANMVAFFVEDYDGDGRNDVAGIVLDDPAPVRLWLAQENGVLGPQLRFEMPAIVEFEPLRLSGRAAVLMCVVEQTARRIVLYELDRELMEPTGQRDAALHVHGFPDGASHKRDTAVADLDGDGLMDLVATDTRGNALVVYRQAPGRGMQAGASYPCYAELDWVVAGNVDDDPYAELFVLSEKEGVVGRCDVNAEGIPYPAPLPLPQGKTPVALNLVDLPGGPTVAVVVKDGRKYELVLLGPQGPPATIDLGSQSRSPEVVLALDADQDGRADLLLLTPDKPMIMLQATDEGFALRESRDMGQFGLVQAVQVANTAVFDVDGDGRPELLVADRNFVRAVRYVPEPPPGVSPGWQVVQQVNADDPASKLVSLAVLGGDIVAADRANDRLVVLGRGDEETPGRGSRWGEIESVNVHGFTFDSIHAGSFSGDGRLDILAVGPAGFAAVRLSGERHVLRELATWRSKQERHQPHELIVGDVNGDGFTDMISLDAAEQMCEIFTFSESGRMLHATGFQVFESRIFSGPDARELEPSHGAVADVTGDGADDLILVAHDRVLIYPQSTPAPSR